MTILVLGGTGLVGKYLVDRLGRMGHELHIITRFAEKARFLTASATPILVDISRPDWLERAQLDLSAYAAIYHMAYADTDDPTYNKAVLVESTRMILREVESLQTTTVMHFIYIGSMSVYGMSPKDEIVSETSEKVADTPYAANKIEATEIVMNSAGDFLRTVLHPTGVYDATSRRIQTYEQLLRSGYIVPTMGANGANNIVHAHDLASALVLCLSRASGVKAEEYIINGESLPYREWFGLLEGAIGVKDKPCVSASRMWSRRSILGRILMKCGFRVPIFLPAYKTTLYENKTVFSSEKASAHFLFRPEKSFRAVCEEIASCRR